MPLLENGVRSAVKVASKLGVRHDAAPWQEEVNDEPDLPPRKGREATSARGLYTLATAGAVLAVRLHPPHGPIALHFVTLLHSLFLLSLSSVLLPRDAQCREMQVVLGA